MTILSSSCLTFPSHCWRPVQAFSTVPLGYLVQVNDAKGDQNPAHSLLHPCPLGKESGALHGQERGARHTQLQLTLSPHWLGGPSSVIQGRVKP